MSPEQAHDAIARALSTVAPEADLADVDADSDLREQLELDSMDFLNLVVRLDELTGVAIAEADYPKLETLSGAVQFLVARAPSATPT